MNILVLNSSPKGKYSITMQTVNYIAKHCPGTKFEVLEVGRRIRSYEKDFSSAMKQLNRRHDLIALQICDPIEKKWPVDVPILLEDAETGELIAVGGNDNAQLQSELAARSEAVKSLCRSAGVDHVEIESGSEVLKPLIKFFAARNRRQRR